MLGMFDDYERARNTTDVRFVGRNFRARETARPSCRSPK